jgi:tetratricopeptide (TPR) repeat protein
MASVNSFRYFGLTVALLLPLMLSACGGAKAKPDPALIAEAKRLASQGSELYDRGCYAQAERFFFRSLETSRLMNDRPAIAKARNNLGAASLAQGNLEKAGAHLSKALDLNESLNNPALDSLILGNLAALAFKSGNREDAESLWRQALETAQTDEAQTGAALHQSNLGMLYRLMGRFTEAETFLRQAQAAALAAGQTGILAGVHSELGLLFQTLGDLDLAEQHFKTALDLDKETENPRGIAEDLENLGRLYQQGGKWGKAAIELDQAIYLRAALAQPEQVKALFNLLKTNKVNSGEPENLEPYRLLVEETEKNGESVLCP